MAEGRRVVVVERDAGNRYLDRARALQVPVVIADATQRQTHAAVNLADASAVAILTSADLTNIETGLAVRESLGDRWDVVPVVLRVFDRDLARMMERNFGFRHVRSTSALAAPWFVGAALGLDVWRPSSWTSSPSWWAGWPSPRVAASRAWPCRTCRPGPGWWRWPGRPPAGRSSTRPGAARGSRGETGPTCSGPMTSSSTCCDGTSVPPSTETTGQRLRFVCDAGPIRTMDGGTGAARRGASARATDRSVRRR